MKKTVNKRKRGRDWPIFLKKQRTPHANANIGRHDFNAQCQSVHLEFLILTDLYSRYYLWPRKSDTIFNAPTELFIFLFILRTNKYLHLLKCNIMNDVDVLQTATTVSVLKKIL